MDADGSQLTCRHCHHIGCSFADDDGRFYCDNCNTLVEDIIDNANADDAFLNTGAGGLTYDTHHTRNTPAKSALFDSDHIGPSEPADFGDVPKGVVFCEEDYYKSIRMRYVLGVQLMVQQQCKKLVEEFQVNSVICGIAADVWLRFIAKKKVFDDVWADEVIKESENQGEKKYQIGRSAKFKNEPRNLYRERMAIIWCKSLKKTIPLPYSLAISYLACHIAREAVFPSDIMRWAIEGKLPYFGAFPKIAASIKEIEKTYERPSLVCPLEANYMFRPMHAISLQKLETMAASIALSIGLNLPPVNFYLMASRYLKQLSLPVEKILPYACHIQEWAMPPELWLSTNENRVPTRVCVMSILIVAVRILYNINGIGKWEMTLPAPVEDTSMGDDESAGSVSDESNTKDEAEAMSATVNMDVDPDETSASASVNIYESDCAELLQNLEKTYKDSSNRHDYYADLPSYLLYCKDVVFAGLEPLYKDPSHIEELWDFYRNNLEDIEESEPGKFQAGLHGKRLRDSKKQFATTKNHRTDEPTISPSGHSSETMFEDNEAGNSYVNLQDSQPRQTPASCRDLKNSAIRHMKIDMEEHRFCYITPRVKLRLDGYLHYRRKVDGDGSYTYVAHADYYILLRACAKVAEVDVRVIHYSVLSLERKLNWIENKLDECVQCCQNFSGCSKSNSK